MYLSHLFLSFLSIYHANAESVFVGLEHDNKNHRLLNTKDPHNNGISHEINRALVADHLKVTTHKFSDKESYGKELEDLMLLGTQHISLSYWNQWACKRTDNFLRVLNVTSISSESQWSIHARGMWGFQGNMTLLAQVIRTLPAIVEFHWDTQWFIPAIILGTLQQNHPDCRLYYTIPLQVFDNSQGPQSLPFNTDESRTEQNIFSIAQTRQVLEDTTPRSILESKILYSLKAHIDHSLPLAAEKIELVHQILLTCPSTRELDLHLEIAGVSCTTADVSKCCENPSKEATLAFDFTKHNGMLPPLKVLKLEGYRFDYAVNGTWEDSEVNMPLQMSNMKAWQKHMDWSHLQSLHLSNVINSELRLLTKDVLPSLLHFRVDGGHLNHVRADITKYITKIPSLETLAVEEIDMWELDALLDNIEKYHSTLHSFKLNHLRDRPRKADMRVGIPNYFWANHFQYAKTTVLNSDQIRRLFTICPDLQSLDLDILSHVDSKWDYETLDTLLSISQLKELTLRFPPETKEQLYSGFPFYRAEEPELRIAMIGLRNYMRKRKVGEELQVLRTFVGWEEFGDWKYDDVEKGPNWMIY